MKRHILHWRRKMVCVKQATTMTHTKTSTLAFISLQTCFPNFQLTQKSRGATAPLAPLLPTPMLVMRPLLTTDRRNTKLFPYLLLALLNYICKDIHYNPSMKAIDPPQAILMGKANKLSFSIHADTSNLSTYTGNLILLSGVYIHDDPLP